MINPDTNVDLKEFNSETSELIEILNDIILDFYNICEIVMNKLQLWDKALDQEASYEANKIWQTNGQWFNWQCKNSLNLTENLRHDPSLLLAVARLLNWIITWYQK